MGEASACLSRIALLATNFSSCFSRAGDSMGVGVLSKNFVQRSDCLVYMVLADDVRRQETQCGVAGAVDENAPFQHCLHDVLAKFGRVDFCRYHQAFTAY